MNDKQFILIAKLISRTGALIAFAVLGVMAAVLLHLSSNTILAKNVLLVILPILVWGIFQTIQIKSIDKLISNYIDTKEKAES